MVGIGGVGMAGLAVLLSARGHAVSGCDLAATPRTRWLTSLGIPVSVGHDPAHVAAADEVIVTPAVDPRHPEVLAAGTRLRYRGEVLADLVGAGESIAVCGSHGKTTTSTWIARLLLALGESVSWCIGGETGDFPVAGCRTVAGRAPVLVVEADESDGTLARYRATMLVVNRCEYDHPDHFRTPADYFACYDAARRQAGSVIESEALDLDAHPVLAPLFADLPLHNRRNARAAVEVALRRGHDLARIAAELPAIVAALPDRRFQKIADGVYTDYAHHPTEMACAVGMARRICSGRLRVLFQPHRYSRTKALLADFPAAFDGADEVVLCPTYAAFEQPVEGGGIADLYAACRARFADAGSPRLYLARSCAEAWEHARLSARTGDLTLLLGAGDIIDLAPAICRDLAAPAAPSPRRIWIGQGSNTWKPDLALAVEYVPTSGPAGRSGAALLAERPTLCPWMVGIPGTIGGWVKMNAGAHGHSISEVIEAVKIDGAWIPAADCGFGYRRSAIAGEIQDVRFVSDPPSSVPSLSAADYLAKRRKFPAGTKGSVFKNPADDSAGRLLESVGAKGLRIGGAYVWPEHANVIVAGPDAVPSDFLALAWLLRARVRFRLGIDLEPEVCGLCREDKKEVCC